MQMAFNDDEPLYRACKPEGIYIKEDGSFSSAIFKDSHGASVDHLGDRTEDEAVRVLAARKETKDVAAITVGDCLSVDACVKHLPEDDNDYHCEVHRSSIKIQLSGSQCKHLVKCARFLKAE